MDLVSILSRMFGDDTRGMLNGDDLKWWNGFKDEVEQSVINSVFSSTEAVKKKKKNEKKKVVVDIKEKPKLVVTKTIRRAPEETAVDEEEEEFSPTSGQGEEFEESDEDDSEFTIPVEADDLYPVSEIVTHRTEKGNLIYVAVLDDENFPVELEHELIVEVQEGYVAVKSYWGTAWSGKEASYMHTVIGLDEDCRSFDVSVRDSKGNDTRIHLPEFCFVDHFGGELLKGVTQAKMDMETRIRLEKKQPKQSNWNLDDVGYFNFNWFIHTNWMETLTTPISTHLDLNFGGFSVWHVDSSWIPFFLSWNVVGISG